MKRRQGHETSIEHTYLSKYRNRERSRDVLNTHPGLHIRNHGEVTGPTKHTHISKCGDKTRSRDGINNTHISKYGDRGRARGQLTSLASCDWLVTVIGTTRILASRRPARQTQTPCRRYTRARGALALYTARKAHVRLICYQDA